MASGRGTAFSVLRAGLQTDVAKSVAAAMADHADDPAYRRAALDLLRESVGTDPAGAADLEAMTELVTRMDRGEQ